MAAALGEEGGQGADPLPLGRCSDPTAGNGRATADTGKSKHGGKLAGGIVKIAGGGNASENRTEGVRGMSKKQLLLVTALGPVTQGGLTLIESKVFLKIERKHCLHVYTEGRHRAAKPRRPHHCAVKVGNNNKEEDSGGKPSKPLEQNLEFRRK